MRHPPKNYIFDTGRVLLPVFWLARFVTGWLWHFLSLPPNVLIHVNFFFRFILPKWIFSKMDFCLLCQIGFSSVSAGWIFPLL
jgi:hypothetical protein